MQQIADRVNLKKEFLLLKGEGVEEFATKHGCKATEELRMRMRMISSHFPFCIV